MNSRTGYRGYIGSRPYFGERAPQHIQNLAIRDFCARNRFRYLLSLTEYAMPSCYMILADLVREAARLDGVVLYSLYMLPRRQSRRLAVCHRILEAGASLHAAVENLSVTRKSELAQWEALWAMREAESAAPAADAVARLRAAAEAGGSSVVRRTMRSDAGEHHHTDT